MQSCPLSQHALDLFSPISPAPFLSLLPPSSIFFPECSVSVYWPSYSIRLTRTLSHWKPSSSQVVTSSPVNVQRQHLSPFWCNVYCFHLFPLSLSLSFAYCKPEMNSLITVPEFPVPILMKLVVIYVALDTAGVVGLCFSWVCTFMSPGKQPSNCCTSW